VEVQRGDWLGKGGGGTLGMQKQGEEGWGGKKTPILRAK